MLSQTYNEPWEPAPLFPTLTLAIYEQLSNSLLQGTHLTMELAPSQLTLKRPVTVKVIVTERWKEEAQQQLQNQIKQLDGQLQQLDLQGQKAIAAVKEKATEPPGPEAQKQIDSVQGQVAQKKNELLTKKNQALQQIQQVQGLELDQEVAQGQMESFFTLEKGDNLVKKLVVEIVVKDGVVEEIRGEL